MSARPAYWLRSVLTIGRSVERPLGLLRLLWGRSVTVRPRSGPALELGHPLDLLIWKEIWIDDEYRIACLGRPECVVDVGAGIGLFAAAVAARHPDCRLVVAEPDPRQHARLRRNLALASADRTEVHECAVSTHASVRLRQSAAPPRSSTVSAGVAAASVEVPARPLARLLPAAPTRIDLLKIDCEGAELDVLRSLDDGAWPRVRRLAIEVHERTRPGIAAEVAQLLGERGYRIEWARAASDGIALLHAVRPRSVSSADVADSAP